MGLGNGRRALFYKRLCLPCEYMQVSVHVILVFSVSHAFRKNISVVACDVTCGLYAHVMNLHFALAQPISSGTCVYRRMSMNIFISPSLLQASTGFNINLTCIVLDEDELGFFTPDWQRFGLERKV